MTRALRTPAFLTALGILVFCAAGWSAAISAYSMYMQKKAIYAPQGRLLRSLPARTEHWERVGPDQTVDAETLKVLGTDNYVTRSYRRIDAADRSTLELHAAYYTNQIDTVPHVPDRCFVGAGIAKVGGPWFVPIPMDTSGWAPHPSAGAEERDAPPDKRVLSVRLPDSSPFGPGRRVRLPRGVAPDRPFQMQISKFEDPSGRTIFAGYFFIANGGWVASANEVRTLAFDLSEYYAYYLKVQVSSTSVKSADELAAQAGSLLDDLMGDIMCCVPDWTEVQDGTYPADNPRRTAAGR
ncbi:MAG: exosortase-associated EpsI family protein [Phycisphaerales bacterium]|nr:exosortase-associated EpsI family protein [Phycisphaerales bacterium]